MHSFVLGMAIAYDATSQSTTTSTSLTYSHTCTGSNLVLILFAYCEANATVTATYNGVSMVQVGSPYTRNTYSPAHNLTAFTLVAPATGAHNIVITASGSTFIGGVSASYTGCAQTGQPDGNDFTTGDTAAGKSSNITITASNCWVVGEGGNDNTTPTGTGAFVSKRTSNAAGQALWDSNTTVSTGSVAYGFTAGISGGQELGAISIKPFAATINSGFLAFM